MLNPSPKPIVLIILDGWGYRTEQQHNPIANTATPTLDRLFHQYPHMLIDASGTAVGLPEGQMGNSEVGHLHLGAGRKVLQDFTRINDAIASGEFAKNPILLDAIKRAQQHKSSIHILGLVSPGGVHSHEKQILACLKLLAEHGVQNYLHAILDGRDTPPKSAEKSLQLFTQFYEKNPCGKIATIMGRYYAMDRDRRWERTELAYQALTSNHIPFHASNANEALHLAYERFETDEFVKPTSIHTKNEEPITIQNGDIIIFMNFRADRARQLSHAFLDNPFTHFIRLHHPKLAGFISLTQYAKNLPTEIIFPPFPLTNTLGEWLASHRLHQLRIAETEKYAHVTYFFNGGIETPFTNEDRELIPSPKVATYDLQPEMSANELTNKLIAAIESRHYDVIICNFANPDMVGHTGIESAANKAVSTIDHCIQRIIDSLRHVGGEMLLTADHGNIEMMYDEQTGQPHTAHTNNPVPFLYVGRLAQFSEKKGALDDVAPTLLYILGLAQPKQMTGHNLLRFTDE